MKKRLFWFCISFILIVSVFYIIVISWETIKLESQLQSTPSTLSGSIPLEYASREAPSMVYGAHSDSRGQMNFFLQGCGIMDGGKNFIHQGNFSDPISIQQFLSVAKSTGIEIRFGLSKTSFYSECSSVKAEGWPLYVETWRVEEFWRKVRQSA